ncbi:MAG: c-type cytochrome, partial [Nitrospirota bacterium]|nr:c-type cytochrome [Nitrospirota bacterium]
KMTRGVRMSVHATPVVLWMVFSFMLFIAQTWAAGDAAKGEKVYKANCAVCHGDKGDGKGPGGASLTPKPTDFTSPAGMKGLDDARLHKSTMEGRPGTAMIGFAKNMNAGDIEDVIAYLKTFGGFGKAK